MPDFTWSSPTEEDIAKAPTLLAATEGELLKFSNAVLCRGGAQQERRFP
jgi:hypothetical protein